MFVWTVYSFIALIGYAFLTYYVADFERSMMTFYEAVNQGHHCYSDGMGVIQMCLQHCYMCYCLV